MTARDAAADAAGTLLVSARELRGAVSQALRKRLPERNDAEVLSVSGVPTAVERGFHAHSSAERDSGC
eukprot:10477965-Prorocentrum_lima.AAC.1